MRLVCPNCDAKYEVPEDAIPETGRDVQCANCGHAWYQRRPKAADATAVAHAFSAQTPSPNPASANESVSAPDVIAPEPVTAEPVAEVSAVEDKPVVADAVDDKSLPAAAAEDPVPIAVGETAEAVGSTLDTVQTEVGATVVPVLDDPTASVAVEYSPIGNAVNAGPETGRTVEATDSVAAAASGDDVDDEVESPAPAGAIAAAGVSAYAVDESVLSILREEAEREVQARKAEAAKPLETQTELGIEAAIAPKAPETVNLGAIDNTQASRLPDVGKINSTLRPADFAKEESSVQETALVKGRSSFRRGFLLVMAIAMLGALVYWAADTLTVKVPSLTVPVKAYVGLVDGLRLQFDGLMQAAPPAANGEGN